MGTTSAHVITRPAPNTFYSKFRGWAKTNWYVCVVCEWVFLSYIVILVKYSLEIPYIPCIL